MKKSMIGIAVAMLSTHIYASEFVIRINPDLFDQMTKWLLVESVSPTNWADSGEPFDCTAFAPLASTIEQGKSFTQSKNCQQKQTGTETRHYEDEFSGATKTELKEIERVTDKKVKQQAIGTLDVDAFWVTNPITHSNWADVGEQFACGEWLPRLDSYQVGFNVNQTQSCSQNQSRIATTTQTNTYTNETRVLSEIEESKAIIESNNKVGFGENNILTGAISGRIDTFGTRCEDLSPDKRSFILKSQAELALGTHIETCNGYAFAFQTDGNFVIYKGGNVQWSTYTRNATHMAFQTDGNVVIYNGSTPLWNFETAGHPNSRLALQEDGNLVLYGSDGRAIKSIYD